MREVQISAVVPQHVKAELDSVSSNKGLKKAFMIEEALSHYFQALKVIPNEMIVPKRISLSEKGAIRLERLLKKRPNKALTDLMNE